MISWVADILALQKSSPQKADTKAQIRQSISHPVMIRRTQIVCLLAMIACMPVFAFTETINGITWTYTVNDGEASVCGGIDAPAISISTMGDIFIPSTLGGCPVTTIESNAFSGCCGLTNVSMPDGIASIGEFAFSECGRLNEIVVPNSVTNIGSGCFAGCTNLVSMTLPFIGEQRGNSDLDGRFGFIFGVTASDGLTEVGSRYIPSSLRRVVITDETVVSRSAFDQCAMLTNIELNEGVCDIGQWALAWCNLTNMIIPNSVTNMGMGVFACCGKLESVTLPFVGSKRGNSGTSDSLFGYVLGNSSYDGGVATKQYYSSSSYSTFYIPSMLRSVVIMGETVLGYGAFYGCSGLTNVTISYGVTDIGIYAFRDCSGLTSIAIPASVTSIGNRAFYGCSGLTSMELPFVGSERGNSGDGGSLFGYIFGIASYSGSVAAIQYCTDDPSSCRTNYVPASLKTVVITDETVLGHGAFGGCDRLESVALPAGVTAIGDAGFSRCSNMMSITIPGDIMSIGESTFRDCCRLNSIDLPDSVTNIGVNAFYNCSGLAAIIVPASVVRIGDYAFYGCSGLAEVVIPESVVSIGYKAFAGCPIENDINYTSAEIRNVVARQRYPWNGKVDIMFEVVGDVTAGSSADRYVDTISVTATDRANRKNYTASEYSLSGDVGTAEGVHHIVWDLNKQGIEIKSDDVVFTVAYSWKLNKYCVIDLSAGSSATSYPVTYLSEPPSGGFNVSEYKTSKLVLKIIEPGSFKMGGSYDVTLTKPFYCGLFEVTQRQWELVKGSNPCSSTSFGKGNSYPVHYVSYNMIRGSSAGAGWPSSSAVDSSSFLGKLRARTGLDFDLPTEAQWEYACRAGTTTTYSYGDSANPSYMWYFDNSNEETHEVGTKLPNPWGFYDMHGNVWEWCLDWYSSNLSSGVTDPKGSSSGSSRVIRGGGWNCGASGCTSSYRYYYSPSYESNNFGFRLVRTLSN